MGKDVWSEKIKSIIEKNLLESYTDQKDFKKSLREFKHNVLSDKAMSKAYAVYDQLSTPQGLSESDAKEFLQEGINGYYQIYFGDGILGKKLNNAEYTTGSVYCFTLKFN